jgi:predicted nucleotide-binding protein
MTISTSLFQLADAVAETLGRAQDGDLKARLSRLDKECEEAKRAWSGSNLGYHADVYTQGLQPGAQFSPEWGLMDRWPTHQPDPRWQVVDPRVVADHLLAAAGISDLGALKEHLTSIREELTTLSEEGVSLLTVASGAVKDTFIDRKLKEVDGIIIADPTTIAADLARDGPDWSRDSEAISQGRRVAAHQRLKAVCLSASVSENGLNLLRRALREAASHMVQLDGTKPSTKAAAASKLVFIGHGHSHVWREFKDFIKDRVGLSYEEFNRVPVAGITNIDRLSQMLDLASIAFLILTAEDERADGEWQARMNVVHEAGLSQGRLGFQRAILLLEDGCKPFSNIEGLGQIRFPKGNIAAAYEEVRRVLEREQLLDTL